MFDRQEARIWPVTLPQIETTVSAYLGPGRVPGNKQGECFSRQISMYLAKHVGGWSTPQIGRFYNGRHHTTVLYAIEKIERLRKQEPSVDALLEGAKWRLAARRRVQLAISSAGLGVASRVPPRGRTANDEEVPRVVGVRRVG
jgi:hypothetical protein